MKHLEAMGAQLSAVGRCALVGILAGMLVGQAVAQGAPALTPQATAQQETSASQTTAQMPAANTANPVAKTADVTSDVTALPEAPAAATESASASMPADMKAMFDDASQDGQNLQPAQTTTTKKGVQRPGMLVLGIAGVPLVILGAMIFSLNVGSSGKANGLRNGLGTAFLAPGAAMSGIGFYFAFHKKTQ